MNLPLSESAESVGPVPEHVTVLRLIHSNYGGMTPDQPVDALAFRPTNRDADGISVYQSHLVTPTQLLSAISDPDKRAKYGVAGLPVKDILALGLSVISTPALGLMPGHASVSELNCGDYNGSAEGKLRCKNWQEDLAKLADRNLILRATS